MSKESILLAKVAALKKNFESVVHSMGRCLGSSVEPLFPRYQSIVPELKKLNPELFSDVPDINIPESVGNSQYGRLYDSVDITPLVSTLDYILEVKSNYRIGENVIEIERKKKIFISHGRSPDWYKVQDYIEKDLKLLTLELAQEPNLGRTVIIKLSEEFEKCGAAVIVMTGDDIAEDGIHKARENVMHEMGFFQGRYGFKNVIVLHENDVNIPSNIGGLVYIGYPKNTIEATFGALHRELKVIFS